MRKEMFKTTKDEPRMLENAISTGKHSYSSMHEFKNVPLFLTVDDEEYFFEVEDY